MINPIKFRLARLMIKQGQSPVRDKTPKVSVSHFGQKSLTGQSTLEYALIIGVVVTALMAMNVYVRRSVQANLKMIEDQLNVDPVPE